MRKRQKSEIKEEKKEKEGFGMEIKRRRKISKRMEVTILANSASLQLSS